MDQRILRRKKYVVLAIFPMTRLVTLLFLLKYVRQASITFFFLIFLFKESCINFSIYFIGSRADSWNITGCSWWRVQNYPNDCVWHKSLLACWKLQFSIQWHFWSESSGRRKNNEGLYWRYLFVTWPAYAQPCKPSQSIAHWRHFRVQVYHFFFLTIFR